MLISDEYRRLNADLHRRATFGQRGDRHVLVVQDLLLEYGRGQLIDYGCGQARLAAALPELDIVNYDPGIKEYSAMPAPAPYVICTDVLEHVEPACLEAVLEHIASLTQRVAHLVIATKLDGSKRLADGRDPHLIVNRPEWWHAKLRNFMHVRCINVTARECTLRGFPKT